MTIRSLCFTIVICMTGTTPKRLYTAEKNIIPIVSGSLKTVLILKHLILPLTHEVLVTHRTKVLNMKST